MFASGAFTYQVEEVQSTRMTQQVVIIVLLDIHTFPGLRQKESHSARYRHPVQNLKVFDTLCMRVGGVRSMYVLGMIGKLQQINGRRRENREGSCK